MPPPPPSKIELFVGLLNLMAGIAFSVFAAADEGIWIALDYGFAALFTHLSGTHWRNFWFDRDRRKAYVADAEREK